MEVSSIDHFVVEGRFSFSFTTHSRARSSVEKATTKIKKASPNRIFSLSLARVIYLETVGPQYLFRSE